MPQEIDKIPNKNNKTDEYFLFLESLNKNIDFTTIFQINFYYSIVEKCNSVWAL